MSSYLTQTQASTTYQTKVLYGTTDPTSSIGSDGDVYIKVGT